MIKKKKKFFQKERIVPFLKRFILWINALILIVLIAFYAHLLSKPASIFDIEGNQILSEDYITEQLQLSMEQSFFDIDTFVLSNRLNRLPWIKQARVIKKAPDTLRILVQERKPIAYFQTKHQMFYIDENQILLQFFADEQWVLPTIINRTIERKLHEGEQLDSFVLSQALHLIKILRNNKTLPLDSVKALNIEDNLNIFLVTKTNQITIEMGIEDFENKIATLHFSMPQLQKLKNKISNIDLRYFNKLIIKKK